MRRNIVHRHALDLWHDAWQRAAGAVLAAQGRIGRAAAEAERVECERLLGRLPSQLGLTAETMALVDRAKTSFVGREQASRRKARVTALREVVNG